MINNNKKIVLLYLTMVACARGTYLPIGSRLDTNECLEKMKLIRLHLSDHAFSDDRLNVLGEHVQRFLQLIKDPTLNNQIELQRDIFFGAIRFYQSTEQLRIIFPVSESIIFTETYEGVVIQLSAAIPQSRQLFMYPNGSARLVDGRDDLIQEFPATPNQAVSRDTFSEMSASSDELPQISL